MTEYELFKHYEDELYQIVRFHNSDISIDIGFNPGPGDILYHVTMIVCGCRFTYRGVHLWKRYKAMVEKLKELYGENCHKYGTKPICPW